MESIEQIDRKIKAIQGTLAEARTRVETLRKEWFRLIHRRERAVLTAHLGGDVITHYRGQHPRFDGLVGKLIAVRRTRCVVEFDGVEWTFPVGSMMPASRADMQGEVISLAGAV